MKRIIAIIAGVCFCLNVQGQNKHEIALHGAGGLSMLNYSPTEGYNKLALGGGGGLSYAYFFNDNWGLSLGIEGMFYNGRYRLPYLNSSYPANDGEDDFEFNYDVYKYSEKQRAFLFNIPLLLHFQTPIKKKKSDFYVALGGKVGLPIRASYEGVADKITTYGYYEHANLPLYDPEFMGFYTQENVKSSGNLSLGMAILVSIEAGVKWYLNDNWALYTGLYADIGLNHIGGKSASAPFVDYIYTNPKPVSYGNVLDATYNGGTIAKKVSPLAIGIKVALAFGWGKSQGKSDAEDEAPPARDTIWRDRVADTVWLKKDSVCLTLDTVYRIDTVYFAPNAKVSTPDTVKPKGVVKTVYLAPDTIRDTVVPAPVAVATPAPAVKAKPSYSGLVVDGYKFGQKGLSDAQVRYLNRVVDILKQYPDVKFVCIGHTCERDAKEVNYRTGLRRAIAIKEYLVQHGIAPGRITTQSKGEMQPRVPNTSEPNRQKNRRVEIKVVENSK
jgi:hypothetical protein